MILKNNNGWTAQCYPKIDHWSYQQSGEWRGQPILVKTHAESGFFVSCKIRTKTSNKAKDDSEVTGHVTVNPVKRPKKKKSPSALARSNERLAHFLEKKSAENQT